MSKTIPDKIYMQFYSDPSCYDRGELAELKKSNQYNPDDEVTWCEDRIHKSDVVYVRLKKKRKNGRNKQRKLNNHQRC